MKIDIRLMIHYSLFVNIILSDIAVYQSVVIFPLKKARIGKKPLKNNAFY